MKYLQTNARESLSEGYFWDVSFSTFSACPVLKRRSHLQLQKRKKKHLGGEYQLLVVENMLKHMREKIPEYTSLSQQFTNIL